MLKLSGTLPACADLNRLEPITNHKANGGGFQLGNKHEESLKIPGIHQAIKKSSNDVRLVYASIIIWEITRITIEDARQCS